MANDRAKPNAKKEERQNRLAFVFDTLGDPTRLKIFALLMRTKDLCVSDIAEHFGVSVSAASYQLKMLEIVGLVRRERTGKTICYHLKEDDPLVKHITVLIKEGRT